MQSFRITTLAATLICCVSAFGQIIFQDGSQQSRAAVAFDRIVLVKANGTPLQNGTALLNALAAITTASPSNQFFIQLDLGTYDLGSNTLAMKSNVHIGGIEMTPLGTMPSMIRSSGAVTAEAANGANLTNLTLQNTGNNSSVLHVNGVDSTAQNIRVEHLGVSGGTNIGVDIIGGGSAEFNHSLIVLDQGTANGTSIGVNISGTDAGFFGGTVLVAVGDPTAGNSIGVRVGAGTRVDFGELFVGGGETTNVDTGMQVLAGGSCALVNCEFEDTTAALSNSGSVVAIGCLFQGVRPLFNAPGISYVHCAEINAGETVGTPIKNTAVAVN